MPVKHIVLFQFKDDATAEQVDTVVANMLALKDNCLHATTQKPYISSLTGGKDISIEGRQNGMQYGFVVEFPSVEDRDYYVKQDQAHKDFITSAVPILVGATVVDYDF
ncbi:hypothetical protein NPX13_g6342 [Xylaria arbuscula]|uniref:Stress-response A/B barrel domain-containing protein n=1 Tax=Xylaria arbuscula TaxID=114810 RepID=A0A9W8NCT0_9PEZI|nr:hypothetical protein NPX13_g6342 [Xylaria arbuscula]